MYNAYRMRGVFKGFKISQHETSGKGLHPKLLLCIRTKTTEKWPFYQRGKTKEMKGEENMREWRRLEERQDHNEGQKDRTKERSRENQNAAWRTPNNFSQLDKVM